MDRRERTDDGVEAMRAAMDGKQAEMWTALPGIVQSFDPKAMTVTVQPAVKGQNQDERGKTQSVNLPVLQDVPVCFPCGGGFTLTYPIKEGDEALVVFASRCIDGWWQHGDVGERPDERMHDLSDGFAIIGPRAKPNALDPKTDTENVQLRSDDGKAHITMMPDYTIRAQNEKAQIKIDPEGKVLAENGQASATLTPGGLAHVIGRQRIILETPQLTFRVANVSVEPYQGQEAEPIEFVGDIHHRGDYIHTGDHIQAGNYTQAGTHTSTGDQVAGDVSQADLARQIADLAGKVDEISQAG